MGYRVHYAYLPCGGKRCFTAVCLAAELGEFPTAVCRAHAADSFLDLSEVEICDSLLSKFEPLLGGGINVVYQLCESPLSDAEKEPRKPCKSPPETSLTDECEYLEPSEASLKTAFADNENAPLSEGRLTDCGGLAELCEWVRGQIFYNGELYVFAEESAARNPESCTVSSAIRNSEPCAVSSAIRNPESCAVSSAADIKAAKIAERGRLCEEVRNYFEIGLKSGL